MTVSESLPPEIAAPLARFKGEKPPAPQWFTDAVAVEPERFFIEAAGAQIECLAWGERGKPGLLFVHGASAHADWWSFIAPFFTDDYRVAALSLSGMGGSDWRESYDFLTFTEELDVCARAAGLYDSGEAPVYIGHSFGGAIVYVAALAHPDRMRAAIMVDTGFGSAPPKETAQKATQKTAKDAAKDDIRPINHRMPRGRVYPTLEEALARFRFLPSQEPGCLYVTDLIARRSLKRAPLPDGGGEGWTWRFDPMLFPRLNRGDLTTLAGKQPGPCIHMYGEHSKVIARWKDYPRIFAPTVIDVVIPESEHHVMVDQPLALISALRTALALWPPSGSSSSRG